MSSFSSLLYVALLIIYVCICGLGRLTYSERNESGLKLFTIAFYSLLWLWSIGCTLFGGFLCVLPLLISKTAATLSTLLPFNISVLISGILGVLVMFKSVRKILSRFMPLQPESPMHQLALVGLFPNIGIFLSSLLMATPEKLIEMMKNVDLLSGCFNVLLYFLALSIIGIGWGFARNTKQVKERLGLKGITPKQFFLSIGIACGMFLVLTFVLDPILRHLIPTDTKFQETIMQLTQPGKSTGNVPLEIFLVSAMAGLGEEILFRGVLLPIVGLVPSAILFALIHLQYGFSYGFLIVFCCGLILGWIRMRYSTTMSIITHTIYDILALSAVSYLLKH